MQNQQNKNSNNKQTPVKNLQKQVKKLPTETRIKTITIISGRPGIGKTERLKKLLASLARGSEIKDPDRVVIFDVNDEYNGITSTVSKDLPLVQHGTIRRIMPYKRVNGKLIPYSTEDRQEKFAEIVEDYSNGVLVLEDFSSYCVSTRSVNIMSLLNRARHKGVDVIIVVQDIGKVTKELWATIGYYHFHKQTNSIDFEKRKITHFFLVKIADYIVTEQFEQAESAFSKKIFGEKEKKNLQSFCVEIDYLKTKIYGSDWPAYVRAVRKYLIVTDRKREIKDKCMENRWNENNIENQENALNILIDTKYRIYFGGRKS